MHEMALKAGALEQPRGIDWGRRWEGNSGLGDTCTLMFITWTWTWTWKQSRCPSADEWIRKLWYIYTMEYYSATKKNTFE